MEEFIKERKVNKFLVATLVASLVIILAILVSIVFEFGLVENLVMSWILTAIYAVFGIFLIEPVVKVNPVQYIEKPVIQEVIKYIEKPIIKEIQIPMENRIIELVDRPVVKEIVKEVPIRVPVEKKVVRYILRKPRKLKIPKYKYLGSKETKTVHKRNCRFGKLIKKKYKVQGNSLASFKKNKFHFCKSCKK